MHSLLLYIPDDVKLVANPLLRLNQQGIEWLRSAAEEPGQTASTVRVQTGSIDTELLEGGEIRAILAQLGYVLVDLALVLVSLVLVCSLRRIQRVDGFLVETNTTHVLHFAGADG